MTETHVNIGFIVINIASFISIISCIYVCFSILYNGYLSCTSLITKNKHNTSMNYQYKHSLMTILIFWICVTDGLIGLRCLLLFTPQIFVHPSNWFYDGYNGIMCDIFSITDIFFRIQNSLLHIILAYNFLYLLRLKSLQKLLDQKKYHYCIVIIVTFLFLCY